MVNISRIGMSSSTAKMDLFPVESFNDLFLASAINQDYGYGAERAIRGPL